MSFSEADISAGLSQNHLSASLSSTAAGVEAEALCLRHPPTSCRMSKKDCSWLTPPSSLLLLERLLIVCRILSAHVSFVPLESDERRLDIFGASISMKLMPSEGVSAPRADTAGSRRADADAGT